MTAPSQHDSQSTQKGKKLLDQLRDALRAKHYSYRTEQTYMDWCKRYTLRVYHNKRHPAQMGATEVQAFITYLATDRNVAASTQNQALSAVLFLYRHVLLREIDFPTNVIRAKKRERLPTVLTKAEALSIIARMNGPHRLMVQLLFGSELRLTPALARRCKCGVPSFANQGYRFLQPSDHCARRQRRK